MSKFFRAPFDVAEAHSHALIQGEFGDWWEHRPMEKLGNVNGSTVVPDRTRPCYTLIATFTWDTREARLGMKEARVVDRKPLLFINKNDLQTGVQRGDWFIRQSSGIAFEVVKIEKDGLTGIEAFLNELGVKD